MNTIACSACLLLMAVLFPPARCNGTPCDNYNLKVTKIESCDSNSVITFEKGFNASFVKKGDKCYIVPEGCVNVAKKCDQMMMTYIVKKGFMKLPGNMDGCQQMKQNQDTLAPMFAVFGAGGSCPIQPGKNCDNDGKGVDISDKNKMLKVAVGVTDLNLKINHGDGSNSCVKVTIKIDKKKK